MATGAVMLDKWRQNAGRIAVWMGLSACAVYLVMVLVTLPHPEDVANLAPFDLRPGGYSLQAASDLLTALGPEGRSNYLTRQIPLDMVFPALYTIALISLLFFCERAHQRPRLTRIGVTLTVLGGLCDYCENLGVGVLLMAWPDVPAMVVQLASAATVTKFLAIGMAVLVAAAAAVSGWRHRRARAPRP